MSTYLVRMTPIEPFTFGGEKGFKFDEKEKNSSYYQMSKDTPEQTTIIGMLRYAALQNKSMLKSFKDYTPEDKIQMGSLIGEHSFSFDATEFQMGKIDSVSPLFIVDHEKELDKMSVYIKSPLNNISHERYEPMEMEKEPLRTSKGVIRIPTNQSLGTKTWLNYGFINIGSKVEPKAIFAAPDSEERLFDSAILTGNRKNGSDSDEDGFFKREVKWFHKKGYSFAVYVECEEGLLPEKTLVSMGLRKSTFMVETISVEKNDLEERIGNALKSDEVWYYALGDVLPEYLEYNSYAIVFRKQIRNINTNIEEKEFHRAVRRNEKLYNLVEAGSVFYEEAPQVKENDNLKRAGYNWIVKIGGEK